MRIGVALPQYDYSVPGEYPLRFETIVEYAREAERLGFDSLWVSDHLTLDLRKYGGRPDAERVYDPLVVLAALARVTHSVRLGTLVALEALRPASVLAKSCASLDRISGGRLDIGVGAGWYEPDYAAIDMTMPPPAARLARLDECLQVLTSLLGGGPSTIEGEYHRTAGAQNLPPAAQSPRPPVFVGGRGDRLLDCVARRADGWNTGWAWTFEDYAERSRVLDAACLRIDRDPRTVTRSLGLYTLVGEDDADLADRFEYMRQRGPQGVLADVDLEQWRQGRLVGTMEEVRAQAARWEALGVDELICGFGAVPFAVSGLENLAVAADALCGP